MRLISPPPAVLAAAASLVLQSSGFAATNAFVLNEANCVSGSSYLQVSGSGSSLKIGTDSGMLNVLVQGNGNNWLELLVVGETNAANHTMDLRGYHLNWRFNKSDGSSYGSGTITFSQNSAFAAVKKGTLITISEYKTIAYNPTADSNDGGHGGHLRWAGIDGYGTVNHYNGKTTPITTGTQIDLSTGSHNGTYHLHFWAGDTTGAAGAQTDTDGDGMPFAYSDYFMFQGTTTTVDSNGEHTQFVGGDADAGLFVANNDNWGLQVTDAAGTEVAKWVGEAEANYGGGGVGNDEVFKLQVVASDATGHATYNYAGNYGNALMADGKESTMGVENKWSSGSHVQDLTALR